MTSTWPASVLRTISLSPPGHRSSALGVLAARAEGPYRQTPLLLQLRIRFVRCSVANVAGVITQCGSCDVGHTSRLPIKSFRLCDSNGCYVNCSALGRHAENHDLVDGNRILFFFASSRKGNPGQLWIYHDCHVIVQAYDVAVPSLRKLVLLTD